MYQTHCADLASSHQSSSPAQRAIVANRLWYELLCPLFRERCGLPEADTTPVSPGTTRGAHSARDCTSASSVHVSFSKSSENRARATMLTKHEYRRHGQVLISLPPERLPGGTSLPVTVWNPRSSPTGRFQTSHDYLSLVRPLSLPSSHHRLIIGRQSN